MQGSFAICVCSQVQRVQFAGAPGLDLPLCFQESLEEDLVNSMNTELLQAPLQMRTMDKI